jgi:hypothetical protein
MALPPLSCAGSAEPPAVGLAGVDVLAELVSVDDELVVGVVLALLLDEFFELLQAARPSAATAAKLTAASAFWRGERLPPRLPVR